MEWFSFDGRIDRATYWRYTIILAVASLVLWVVYSIVATQLPITETNWYTYQSEVKASGVVWFLICLGLYLVMGFSSLSVSVRRWHDHGKSGIWVLVGIIPLVGGLYSFYMLGFAEGEDGPNEYGRAPEEGSLGLQDYASSLTIHQHSRLLIAATILGMAGFGVAIRNLPSVSVYLTGSMALLGLFVVLALVAGMSYAEPMIDNFGAQRVSIVATAALGCISLFVSMMFSANEVGRGTVWISSVTTAFLLAPVLYSNHKLLKNFQANHGEVEEFEMPRYLALVVVSICAAPYALNFVGRSIGLSAVILIGALCLLASAGIFALVLSSNVVAQGSIQPRIETIPTVDQAREEVRPTWMGSPEPALVTETVEQSPN